MVLLEKTAKRKFVMLRFKSYTEMSLVSDERLKD
jgi:hypothetical protein